MFKKCKEAESLNLTELQKELQNLQEHISKLYFEIEKMKPQSEDAQKEKFDTVTRLAIRYPISLSSISDIGEYCQKEFVKCLAYLILVDEDELYNRLLYLCRIAFGCKLKMSAEDIYKSGLEFETKDMEILCTELQEYKYTYLIEAFILANLSEKHSVSMMKVIADMAVLLGCDKEEVYVLSQVAKSRLSGNMYIMKDIPLLSKDRWSGKLDDYISKDWLVSQRKKCISICTEYNVGSKGTGTFRTVKSLAGSGETLQYYDKYRTCTVKDRQESGTIVKMGDTILVYENIAYGTSDVSNTVPKHIFAGLIIKNPVKETKTVTAPCNGIVYYIESSKESEIKGVDNKYLDVYVVSYFDNYKDFCEWHKNKTDKN